MVPGVSGMVSAVSRRADGFGDGKELCWWVALAGTVLDKRFLSAQLGQHQWHWSPVHSEEPGFGL